MTAHGHSHSARDRPRRTTAAGSAIVLAITATVLVLEVIGAAVTGSLALLADAGHMLTDAAGLVVALGAAWLMRRPATSRRTWGYVRAEVLAATAQAAVLLAVGVFVLVEGVRRLLEPPEVASGLMVVFGAVGLVGNLVSMAVLLRGRDASLNTPGGVPRGGERRARVGGGAGRRPGHRHHRVDPGRCPRLDASSPP